MIHMMVESDSRRTVHTDCGWDMGQVGDNFCAGCGVELRRFWQAVIIQLTRQATEGMRRGVDYMEERLGG